MRPFRRAEKVAGESWWWRAIKHFKAATGGRRHSLSFALSRAVLWERSWGRSEQIDNNFPRSQELMPREVVPPTGLEPVTLALRMRCSTS
jgi:hypothetical protein